MEARLARRHLPFCPLLRCLAIQIAGEGECARLGFLPSAPSTIPGLVSTLIGDVTFPSLEAFSLFVDIKIAANLYDMPPALAARRVLDPQLGWEELEGCLSSSTAFPKLHAVQVAVDAEVVEIEEEVGPEILFDLQDELEERLVQEVEEAMPGVKSRLESEGIFSAGLSSDRRAYLNFVDRFGLVGW